MVYCLHLFLFFCHFQSLLCFIENTSWQLQIRLETHNTYFYFWVRCQLFLNFLINCKEIGSLEGRKHPQCIVLLVCYFVLFVQHSETYRKPSTRVFHLFWPAFKWLFKWLDYLFNVLLPLKLASLYFFCFIWSFCVSSAHIQAVRGEVEDEDSGQEGQHGPEHLQHTAASPSSICRPQRQQDGRLGKNTDIVWIKSPTSAC